MPVRQQSDLSEKAAVSVSEAAARCGLSRTHFHALVKNGVMPPPCYDLKTRKPFYTRELLDECLRIRRTNVSFDGRICLFYQRRQPSGPGRQPLASRRSSVAAPAPHAELIEGLRAMGLGSVSDGRIDDGLRICFPNGVGSTSEGEVLRSLWQHLRRSQAV
jgi:hypothetical protein